jgi:hypothetical protein
LNGWGFEESIRVRGETKKNEEGKKKKKKRGNERQKKKERNISALNDSQPVGIAHVLPIRLRNDQHIKHANKQAQK